MIHRHPITCLQVLKLYHLPMLIVINSCIIQESDADEALTKVCHDQDQPGMTFIFFICIHTNLSCLYCMDTQPSTLTKVPHMSIIFMRH